MVLIRNNVQKESTYGWYPSQVNVYDNPRAHKGYDKECLFRHWQSGLHQSNTPAAAAPLTPPGFKGSMKSHSRNSRASVTKTPARAKSTNLMITGSRPDSFTNSDPPPQFVFEKSRPASVTSNHIPKPQINKGYHGWQPQPTIIGVIDPSGPFIAPSPKIDVSREADNQRIETPKVDPLIKEAAAAALNKELLTRPITPAQQISGSFRAQSASLNRPQATPTRPVRSAGSRSRSARATSTVTIGIADGRKVAMPSPKKDGQRSKTPSKSCWMAETDGDAEEEMERCASPVNLRTPSPLEYEEVTYESQVDKYGWLAEVHGDPFNLKKLSERLPYTVKCDEPVVADSPYKTRVIVGDTFFINTIPRKPMTFDVHPEWQSEGFVAKRKELQKQGRKFHNRSYGFVY